MPHIGRITVLVSDLDASRRFYCEAFGFEVLFDGEVAPGLRTVHVGPDGQAGAGVWLFRATGPSVERIGAQTAGAPLLVLYCAELESDLERARAAGARVVKPITAGGAALFAHVLDDSGNEIILAQLARDATEDDYRLVG